MERITSKTPLGLYLIKNADKTTAFDQKSNHVQFRILLLALNI